MAIASFTLAQRLRAGETVYSGWCGLPYPIVAETIGRDGFAAVTLDSQHGLWDVGALVAEQAGTGRPGLGALLRDLLDLFTQIGETVDREHFVHLTPTYALVGPAGSEPSIGKAA